MLRLRYNDRGKKMNQAIVVGNLTRDPELMQSNSGVAYCRFDVAVNRQFADSIKSKPHC